MSEGAREVVHSRSPDRLDGSSRQWTWTLLATLVFGLALASLFHGHLTGDQVIKSLASLLRRSFRSSDILGRYGGDEFVVIMQDTSLAEAAVVLNRTRNEFSQISHRSEIDGEQFFTTFSAGISSFPNYAEQTELQSRAERAMYAAKKSGRNKIKLA